ncbi:MAG TPA: tetratricopeptide repeat protein [Thermoanaerobaculia bacterium]|nr:tetratricopeptide repeat protein [Thermoanaerobaculia bacterium]
MTNGYPGNSSLADDVKQRVLTTFSQTLDLYDQGLLDDVVVGCEFVLKMDPQFGPAKQLLQKANDPGAPIDVRDLRIQPAGGATGTGSGSGGLGEARAAFAARQFQRAADLASAVLRADMTNEEAQRIAEEASERIEAEPFIQQFLVKARTAIENGNTAGARTILEKARALDPDHPEIERLGREADQSASAPPPSPSFDPFASFGTDNSPAGTPASPAAPEFDFGSFSADHTEKPTGPDPSGFSTSDSFVVDSGQSSPAEGGRSAAPASDFGFTFEEDKDEGPQITIGKTSPGLHGFGGATAQEAAEQASGDTFDFAAGSVDLSSEDRSRIEDYLRQGDEAVKRQEYQKAIDVWSRIFLIDVTNDQASQRIEKARLRKMEIDAHVDDLSEEATLLMQRGDAAGARKANQKILELDPANAAAMERLAEIDLMPAGGIAAAPATAAARPSGGSHPFDEALFLDEPSGGMSEEVLVPPTPGEARRPPQDDDEVDSKTRPVAAASGGRSKTLIFGAIGLVVLLGLGLAAWKIFLSDSGDSAALRDDPVARAQQMVERGQIDQAIAMLLAVPLDHPRHDDALAYVADLKSRKAAGAGTIAGRPAAEVFQEQIEKGRQAFLANDYVTARAAFEQAASIQQLPPDVQSVYQRAIAHAARLEDAANLLKSGNYTESIAAAEALLAENPDNVNARQLIDRARFNIGVRALQEERLTDAVAAFDQVLATNPDDALARRARELAIRYETTSKDLLYRIFVKYLQPRQ